MDEERRFGRIAYIDPNVAAYSQREGTNSDMINFPYDDYTMAIDLIIRRFNRYSCGMGETTGEFKDYKYSTNEGNISFLGGSEIENGGNEKYLTTNFTDISLTSPADNTQECLGIESIDITYQSWFHPQVVIKFVDVRGGTVMSQAEHAYYNPNDMGRNSDIYRAFFTLPYPIFILKVKGFYGKGVTYKLAVTKTNIDFDGSTGNFIITAEFIGYMYGFLADIPMTFLSIAPYTESGSDYWRENVENGRFYFRSSNGSKSTPMLTLVELKGKIYDALKSFSGSTLAKSEVNDEVNSASELASLNNLIAMYKDTFGVDGRTMEVTDNSYIDTTLFLNASKNYMEKEDGFHERVSQFFAAIKEHDNTFSTSLYNDFSSLANCFTTAAATQGYYVSVSYNDKDGFYPNDAGIGKSYKWDLINHKILKDKRVIDWVKQAKGSNSSIGIFCFEKGNALKNKKLSDIVYGEKWENYKRELSTRGSELKKKADEEKNKFLAEALGFIPSIRNIYELIFAHLDTFLHVTYRRLQAIKKGLDSKEPERKKEHYDWIRDDYDNNYTDTEPRKHVVQGNDVVDNVPRSHYLPPFVAYYEDNSESNKADSDICKEKRVLVFPDKFTNGTDLQEVHLVYELLSGAKMFYEKAIDEENREATNINPVTNIEEFIPLTLYDIAHNGMMENPYACLAEEFKSNQSDVLGHFVFIFAMRAVNFMTTTVNYKRTNSTNNKDYSFGRIEAYNFYKAVGEVASKSFYDFLKLTATDRGEKKKASDFVSYLFESEPRTNISSYWINSDKRSLFKEGNDEMIYNYSPPTNGLGFTYFPLNITTASQLKSDMARGDELYSTRNDYITTTKIKEFSGSSGTFRIGEPFNGGSYFIVEERDLANGIYNNLAITKALSDEKEEITPESETYGQIDKNFLKELRSTDINRLQENLVAWDKKRTYCKDVFMRCDEDGKWERPTMEDVTEAMNTSESDEDLEMYYIQHPVMYSDNEYEDNADGRKNKSYWDLVYDLYFSQRGSIYFQACLFLFGIPLMGNGFDTAHNNGNVPKVVLLREGAWYWFQNNKNNNSMVKLDGYKIPGDDEYFASINSKTRRNSTYYPFYLIKSGSSERYAKVPIQLIKGNRNKNREKYLEEYFKQWANREYLEIGTLLVQKDLYAKNLIGKGEDNEHNQRRYIYGLDIQKVHDSQATTEDGKRGKKLQELLKNLYFKEVTQFDYYREMGDRWDKEDGIPFQKFNTRKQRIEDSFRGFLDSMEKIYKDSVKYIDAGDYDTINEKAARLDVEDPFRNDSLKLSTYMTLKNIYDKWICGFPRGVETFTMTQHNYAGIGAGIDNFIYCDNYFNDIGDILTINLTKITEWFNQLIPSSSLEGENGEIQFKSESVYEFLAKVAELVGAYLVAIPQKFMYYDSGAITNAFKPIPACHESDWDDDTSTYMVLYTYKPSEHLGESEQSNVDMNGWSPDGDGFDLTDDEIAGRLFRENGSNMLVPAFGVTFGKQNQSYFKNISLSTASPGVTEASITNTLAIASKSGEEVRTTMLYGQDIYKVYSNYAYSCTIEMLGCMQIFPPMYFQLNNVPMWKGAYMIQKVKHSIKPGDITTTITGVRVNKYAIPMMDTQVTGFIGRNGSDGSAEGIEGLNVSSSVPNIGFGERNITGNRNMNSGYNEEFNPNNVTELKPLICFTPAHGPETQKANEYNWSARLIDDYIIPKLKNQKFYDGTSYADNIHRCKCTAGKNGYNLRDTEAMIKKYGSKQVISIVPHWNGTSIEKDKATGRPLERCSRGSYYHAVYIAKTSPRSDSYILAEYLRAAGIVTLDKGIAGEFKKMPNGFMKKNGNSPKPISQLDTDPAVTKDCACCLTENFFGDFRNTDVCWTDSNYTQLDSDNRFVTGRAWLESEEGMNAISDLHVMGIVNYIKSLKEGGQPQLPVVNNSGSYDIDKACEYISSHAAASSTHKCAMGVRLAIEAGGLNTTGRPVWAYKYADFLPKLGFTRVSTFQSNSQGGYTPVKGDIAVYKKGNNTDVPGHICMFDGTRWYSDFKQNNMYVYGSLQSTIDIFRYC